MKLLTLAITTLLLWGCSKNPQKRPAKYTDFERGWLLHYYKKPDSALQMFNRYLENPDDSLKKGTAYSFMGEIYWDAGDLYGAEENAVKAIHTLEKFDTAQRTQLGHTYHLSGNISFDLKHYDDAIAMYNKAITFFSGDEFLLEVMNGKATAFQKKGDYNSALVVYDSILALNPANQSLVARAIDNKARTKWLQDPAYPVIAEFWSALKIRVDSQYKAGLNASYAHLSDYYVNLKPDSALWYAQKMLDQAKENQSPDDILEAIDKLIRLNGSRLVIEDLYDEFKKLSDSLQLARDTTRNRFALIRYDNQKSKADNLVLKDQNRSQRLWMYGLAAFALAVITGLSLWYTKRRNRLRLESENAIRDSKLKLSQKVHDVVANSLYRIMNELEHTDSIDKELLLDNIEGVYEKSRDISYEDISSGSKADRDKQIHHLLTAFAGGDTNVYIIGNEQTFWNRLSNTQEHELDLVLNELMINMKKHSQAKKVVIEFKQANNKSYITYKDDGVGFSAGFQPGNGLKNTVSRIKSLNGDITFGESGKAAVSIEISFPLQSGKT